MSKVDDWKRPDGSLFMNAYYYAFEPTRYEPVDRVLSAVAIAGKWSHHTDAWTDTTPGCWSPVETIQQEATRCADAAADMAHKLASYASVVEAAKAWRAAQRAFGDLDADDIANSEDQRRYHAAHRAYHDSFDALAAAIDALTGRDAGK